MKDTSTKEQDSRRLAGAWLETPLGRTLLQQEAAMVEEALDGFLASNACNWVYGGRLPNSLVLRGRNGRPVLRMGKPTQAPARSVTFTGSPWPVIQLMSSFCRTRWILRTNAPTRFCVRRIGSCVRMVTLSCLVSSQGGCGGCGDWFRARACRRGWHTRSLIGDWLTGCNSWTCVSSAFPIISSAGRSLATRAATAASGRRAVNASGRNWQLAICSRPRSGWSQ